MRGGVQLIARLVQSLASEIKVEVLLLCWLSGVETNRERDDSGCV